MINLGRHREGGSEGGIGEIYTDGQTEAKIEVWWNRQTKIKIEIQR